MSADFAALMARADQMRRAWRIQHADIATVVDSGHLSLFVEPFVYDLWQKGMDWPRASEVVTAIAFAFQLQRPAATRILLFTLAENRPWLTFEGITLTTETDFLANHKIGLRDAILGYCGSTGTRVEPNWFPGLGARIVEA